MPKPAIAAQNTELSADPERDRRQRRRFSSEEKLRILKEADGCKVRGEAAALLRREGVYSSHLAEWRQQVRAYGEAGLVAKASLFVTSAIASSRILNGRKRSSSTSYSWPANRSSTQENARDSRCRAAESRQRRGAL